MLNPLNSRHRERLPRAVEHVYSELRKYSRARENTIRAYLGVSRHTPEWDWMGFGQQKYEKALPKGNLLQTAGLSLQIALAYGEPEYLVVARQPQHYGLAYKLDPNLNRMSKLLDLGDTARAVAADSFFGYGIFKVGVGRLPYAAQQATGLTYGPCIWRVSQDDYGYDISVNHRSKCAFEYDLYTMPIEDAIERWPNDADRLNRLVDMDRLDARRVMARPSQFYAPEPEVLLMDMYFPGSRTIGTWPVNIPGFGELTNEALEVREFEGHWSGVYEVLNHLYSPDELIPLAQAESVKAIHFLFQDLMEATAHQARSAKVNPIYQAGSDKDMKRIWDAADRYPVGVTDPSRFGTFEIPGPSQSQTSYMAAVLQLFKQMNQFVDEPHRAPTATQGTLERETTNAIVGEARRKFNRSLQLVGYKTGHLMLNDNSLKLPASRPVMPGSKVMVDASWLTPAEEPRTAKIDDLDVSIEPFSTRHRSAEEKRDLILGLIERMAAVIERRAMGAPINVEKVLEIMARYSGTPELLELFEELQPHEQAVRSQSRSSAPRVGAGHYVRENISTKTDEGAFIENMNEAGTEGGETRVA